MDHLNVQDLSKTSIRPLLPTRSRSAGARCPFVSCSNGVLVQLGVVLVLFSFLHSADSFSSSCVKLRRGTAAEHTIQARGQKFTCHHDGSAPGNQNSYGHGSERRWSCIDLEASPPRKPFFLQSTSHHGKDVVPSSSSLRKIKEPRLNEKLRTRNHSQDWVVVDIETKCTKDDQNLSTASFSKLISDEQKLPLELASSPYRCNSTLTAPTTTETGASESTSETRESTDSATASFHFRVKFSPPRRSWLLQTLEEVDEQLQAASCDGDGAQSEVERRMTARRSLLTRSWKPVLVIDSVIVIIGFVLAVSALSCWVRQHGAVYKSDTDITLPVMTPSTPIASLVTGSDQNRSPITGPGSRSPVDEGSGRQSPVEEGSGRRSPVEVGSGRRSRVEEGSGRRSPVEEGSGRWSQVEEDPGRTGSDQHPSLRSGSGPIISGSGSGRWERARKPEEEEATRTGRVLPGAGQGSLVNAPEGEGEGDTATAHRSGQTARYRAEPFCFEGLATATGDFAESNKLGAGSFGTVYRGLLVDGRVVAIKRADSNNIMLKMVDKQCAFKAELDVMSRLHHKHLVNLVGYCDDSDEMMLVYEYMPNGTLADHLHDKRFKSRSLSSWKIRVRVALQAARGIEYLHTYAEPPVIHRDIKPSNLLLDAKGFVRVSDFGLCLIFPTASENEEEDLELVNTNAAGTMGYMDPEYYRHRHLTTKSDVYSFGVVILELLTGKRAIHRHNNSPVSVVDYAVPAIEAGELARIVDPGVRVPTGHEFAAMKVMAEVGSQAVRLRGKDRPSMTEIVRRLEQAVTLCRSRHAPLPDSGAQIGSSSDPSDSSSPPSHPSEDGPVGAFHLDSPAAALFDKFMGSVEDEEGEAVQGTTGTDVAQLGLVDVALELLRDIPHNGPATHDDDGGHDKSDINLELYRNAEDEVLGRPLARATVSAAGSNHTMDTGSSSSSAADAQAAVYNIGGKSLGPEHPSSRSKSRWPEHRETLLLEELRESWWRRSRLSKRIKLGASEVFASEVFDTFPKEGSSDFSCKGCSNAPSNTDISLDYCSRKVEDDPSLDQSTTVTWSTEFSNFGDSGPVEDVVHSPADPPPPEPSHGSGPPAAVPEQDQRGEFKESAENSFGDIDIESVLVEYSGEQAKSITYAGFSNFSVLHDLDELMRALHCTSAKAGGWS